MASANALASAAGIGATDNSAVASSQGSNTLGKDDFLKLLMAQMGNQDPTAPTDSSAFVAQLAQFSSLEMQQTTNSDLENLLVGQASANQTAMTSYVGKDVDYTSNHIALAQGGTAVAHANLPTDADAATATILDGQGNVVRTMQLGSEKAGALTIPWDGLDDKGNVAPAGTYTVNVTAKDKAGASIIVSQSGTGHVTGISYDNGVASLEIDNGMSINISDIDKVKERTTP